MSFSSITFIYVFLAVCLLCYYVLARNIMAKNIVLLIFSIIFYASEKLSFVLLMFACILLTYINARLIEANRGKKIEKVIYIIGSILGLLPLLYFKYTNFIIENISNLFGLGIVTKYIVLPLGISFYTFQMLSYLIDVKREKIEAEKNILNLALYICFFPQLVAGPIVKYTDMKEQIKNREHSIDKFNDGITTFVIGLSKKVLLANQLGELCALYNNDNATIVMTWMYGIAYMMQVYFDFCGYSEMALGLGKMFGFELPRNFNFPFIATSIKDFWKRWHITLSSFFKDYVYIPLGGSRNGKVRTIINLFVVWGLTGLWHGADWNFILWGLLFFVLLMTEKNVKIQLPNVINHIITLFAIMVSFIIFGSNGFAFIQTIKNLFIGTIMDTRTLFYVKDYIVIVIISMIGCTPIIKNIFTKYKDNIIIQCIQPVLIVFGFIVSSSYLINGSFNPFLYFRF